MESTKWRFMKRQCIIVSLDDASVFLLNSWYSLYLQFDPIHRTSDRQQTPTGESLVRFTRRTPESCAPEPHIGGQNVRVYEPNTGTSSPVTSYNGRNVCYTRFRCVRYTRFRCSKWPVYEMAGVRNGRCTKWPVYEMAGIRSKLLAVSYYGRLAYGTYCIVVN